MHCDIERIMIFLHPIFLLTKGTIFIPVNILRNTGTRCILYIKLIYFIISFKINIVDCC